MPMFKKRKSETARWQAHKKRHKTVQKRHCETKNSSIRKKQKDVLRKHRFKTSFLHRNLCNSHKQNSLNMSKEEARNQVKASNDTPAHTYDNNP